MSTYLEYVVLCFQLFESFDKPLNVKLKLADIILRVIQECYDT